MILLQWVDNSSNELGFLIQRESQISSTSWGNLVTINIDEDVNSCTDDAPIGIHRYRIQSFNNTGSSSFTNWTIIQNTPLPAAPTEFVVTNTGDGSTVQLSWKDNSSTETTFHLVWDKMSSNGQWTRQPVINIPANTTSYVHRPGSGQHRYCIRSAYSVMGQAYKSELTPWVEVNVQIVYQPPLPPTDFSVILRMDQKTVDFFWRDNSSNETVFHLVPQKLINGIWTTLDYIRIPANRTSYSYKPGSGDWKFAIRSAYSINGYAYKSALTPWIQIHVPL